MDEWMIEIVEAWKTEEIHKIEVNVLAMVARGGRAVPTITGVNQQKMASAWSWIFDLQRL
jgi:hypothetical protein